MENAEDENLLKRESREKIAAILPATMRIPRQDLDSTATESLRIFYQRRIVFFQYDYKESYPKLYDKKTGGRM